MANVALLAHQQQDAGNGYTVPGAQEIIIRSVKAEVDGASAAGNFQAALQIVAPSGDVMGTYPVSVTTTAGGSVDPSWFPRGTVATSSSASTPILVSKYEAFATGAYTPGVSNRCSWSLDSGPALFDLTDPVFPAALAAGIYRFYAVCDITDDGTTIDSGALIEWVLAAGGEINAFATYGAIEITPPLTLTKTVEAVLALEDFLNPANDDGPQASWVSSNTAEPNAGFTRIIVTFTAQASFNP